MIFFLSDRAINVKKYLKIASKFYLEYKDKFTIFDRYGLRIKIFKILTGKMQINCCNTDY